MEGIIKKEIKIVEGLELRNLLEQLKTENVKFNYRIIKLKKLLNEELKEVDEMIKPSDDFMKYESNRLNLLAKYGERNENGSLKIENDNVIIAKDKSDEFYKEVEELKEKFKNAIEEREKQISQYEEFIDSETITIEFKVTKIDEIEGIEIPMNILEKLIDIGFIEE